MNLEACALGGIARVVRGDVASMVGGPVPSEAPFDLVVADPPYSGDEGTLGEVLVALERAGWTAEGARVVLECRSGAPPALPEPWRVVWERSFGDTLVLFLAG